MKQTQVTMVRVYVTEGRDHLLQLMELLHDRELACLCNRW